MDPAIKRAVQRIAAAFLIWIGLSMSVPWVFGPILVTAFRLAGNKTVTRSFTPHDFLLALPYMIGGICAFSCGWILLGKSGWRATSIREKTSERWNEETRPAWRGVVHREARQVHDFAIYPPGSELEISQKIDALIPSSPFIAKIAQALVADRPTGLLLKRRDDKIMLFEAKKNIAYAFVGRLGHDSSGRPIVRGRICTFTVNPIPWLFTIYSGLFAVVGLGFLFFGCLGALFTSQWLEAAGFAAAIVLIIAFATIWARLNLGSFHHLETKVTKFWRERFDAEVELSPRRSWIIF